MSFSSPENLSSPPPFAKEIIQGQEEDADSSPEKAEKYLEALLNIYITTQKRERLAWIPLVKADIDIAYDILLNKCLGDHQAIPYCGRQFPLSGFPERTNSKTKSKAGNSL